MKIYKLKTFNIIKKKKEKNKNISRKIEMELLGW